MGKETWSYFSMGLAVPWATKRVGRGYFIPSQ